MTQLSKHDLAEVLERTIPDREVTPQLAGRARAQAEMLRRRRRRAIVSVAAAAVLVLAVPVTVSVLDEPGGDPAGEPTAGPTDDAVPCADDECGPATVISAIRRPLRLPTAAAGEACPVSPTRRLPGGTFVAVGSGPVQLVGADRQQPATVTMSASEGTWLDQKVYWAVDTGYSGPLLLRGGRIDGDGLLRFDRYLGAVGYTGGAGDGLRHPELAYVRDGLNADGDSTSSSYPSGIHVSSPGCYAIQVDGAGFSQTLVFRAAPP